MEDINNTSVDASSEIENKVPENMADLKELSKEATQELAAADSKDGEEKPWEANFKVKAYDKEYEIPEKFRGLITKENEKDFRDTFEKSFALEVMKEKNAKIREANEGYQNRIEKELAPTLQRYQKVESYLKKDDFDSFIEKSGIPDLEKKIQAWMLRKLQLNDLPADQQAMYNEKRAADLRAEQLEEENSRYKQTFEAQSLQQKEAVIKAGLDDLDAYTRTPGIEEVAKSFDTRLGKDGEFKLEVLRRAAVVARQLGRDVSVKEAVDDFVKMLGGPVAQNSTPEQSGSSQATPKPLLPSLNGKATSPAVQKIKSFDDLRKISKQVIAQASKASRE
jgi:hypothetical protein